MTNVDFNSEDIIVNTNSASNQRLGVLNSQYPTAFTFDEVQASKKYEGGTLIDIDPTFVTSDGTIVECDLTSLEIQVNERYRLNTQNASQLIYAFVPDKVENADCEVSYSNEYAVISDGFTGIVTEAFEIIDPYAPSPFGPSIQRLLPGETSGKNSSQNAILLAYIVNNGTNSEYPVWFEIETEENQINFNQVTQSSLDWTNSMNTQSSYNGNYLIEMVDANGADPGEHRVYQKGVGGWKTFQTSDWYNQANIWYENYEFVNELPLHKVSDNGSQGIVGMEDGKFLLTGARTDLDNQGAFGSYAVLYDPTNDSFETYEFTERAASQWDDILGCEANNPENLRDGVPDEFFNELGQLTCRKLKNIRFGSYDAFRERYDNWLINIGWPQGEQAHNILTNENTGVLRYSDRPTGNWDIQGSERQSIDFNERYKNFIHIVTKNSLEKFSLLRRFNLDDQSFVDFDMSAYEDYVIHGYDVYLDLVMFDVTDPSDGNRKYVEFNFETSEISDRGSIDEGGFTIISFVNNSD